MKKQFDFAPIILIIMFVVLIVIIEAYARAKTYKYYRNGFLDGIHYIQETDFSELKNLSREDFRKVIIKSMDEQFKEVK